MAVVSSRASAWRVREPERYAQRLTAVVSTRAIMAMARSRFMARSFPGCSVFLPRDPFSRSGREVKSCRARRERRFPTLFVSAGREVGLSGLCEGR